MCFLYFSLSIEATDLLQKLSLDSQTKTLEIPEPTKKVICTLWFMSLTGQMHPIFHIMCLWESEFLILLMEHRNLLGRNLLKKKLFRYIDLLQKLLLA